MMTDHQKIKVYALLDLCGCVLAVNSSVFLSDPTGWILIDEGEGEKYAHAQGQYLSGLMSEEGIPRYRWDGKKAIERTATEMQAATASIQAVLDASIAEDARKAQDAVRDAVTKALADMGVPVELEKIATEYAALRQEVTALKGVMRK